MSGSEYKLGAGVLERVEKECRRSKPARVVEVPNGKERREEKIG